MIRNWEIIRAILLRLEQSKTPNTVVRATDFSDFPEQEVAYNMRLLDQAGFVLALYRDSKSGDGKINNALARYLTNAGHDLLDTIRNDSVWNKIKEKFKSKSLDMTFDLVLMVGKGIMETILES